VVIQSTQLFITIETIHVALALRLNCFTPFCLNALCRYTPNDKLEVLHGGQVENSAREIIIVIIIIIIGHLLVGRDSVVGTATRYGPEGPGMESRWGRNFPYLSRPALGPPSLLYNGYRVSFPGVKRPGLGVDLHLYSPSGPSWPVPR
jgi:hypothetical protein